MSIQERREIPKTQPRRAKTQNRLTRAKIRQLKSGERIPEGEPKRYKSQAGYIRLRWLVGTQSYVEVYEHRVVDGVVTDAEQVHHRNENKADNRPENLEPISRTAHARLHGAARPKRYGRYRTRERMERAQRMAAHREKREEATRQMQEMYASGANTLEIAKHFGIDASGVSRRLRQAGTRMRHARRRTDPTKATRSAVQARAGMCCERCARNLTWGGGEIHHLKNRSQGGGNDFSNLTFLCRECHGWITTHPAAAWEEGFHLKSGEAPGSRPIVSGLHGYVLLDDHGGIRPAGGAA